jgi:hypothetical protein
LVVTTGLPRRAARIAGLAATVGASIGLANLALAEGPDASLEAFFGETHVHTSWSLDSYLGFGVRGGPKAFYDYARGGPVERAGGLTVQLRSPLDWAATTEHAEYLGAVQSALDPDSRLSGTLAGRSLKFGNRIDSMATYKLLAVTLVKGYPMRELMAPDVLDTYWKKLVEIADEYYEPGVFTTFAAYEWTSTPQTANLHRNIFFADSGAVPDKPFSAIDSDDPRDLWKWMDAQREEGNELLAIAHNPNLSNGRMFTTDADDRGRPIDRAWAEARMRNEPLVELKQVKGQSETTPFLSPNDEFANYEVFIWQLLGGTGAPRQHGSYVRQAYRDGLALGRHLGANPYKFGVVSGSDVHNVAIPYRQDDYFGVHGTVDDSPEERMHGGDLGMKNTWPTPAGLTAVWAEENTRAAIFAGMKRKETYSTSGVRIRVRLFAGWDFDSGLLEKRNWTADAYARGVPMGGELPPSKQSSANGGSRAPRFVVWATKDPDSANLDRVQIVKGWTRNGQTFERVFDVAWSGERTPDPHTGAVPSVGNTVDLSKGTYQNTIGATALQTVWVDPEFDPALDAFYYARVLEIPTPRWSTIEAVKLGMVPPSGAGFQPVVQERAWTSPIWHTADARDGNAEPAAVTVTGLTKKGAAALDEAQLRALLVGKTVTIRNTVTDKRFEILHGADGRRLITAVDGDTPDYEIIGDLAHSNQLLYTIERGRYVVQLAGSAIEATVYRLGDRYYAARSNEFGYANYEVLPGD